MVLALYKRSLSLLITSARSKVAKIPLVVLWVRWTLEKSGGWGAAGHPSSSQWRTETTQGDVSHVTGEGSWVSSMSWCAAHPSRMGFYVVRCSSILHRALCHCALLIHLAWGSMLLCAAHPSYVESCVIVRCTSILRGILCHGLYAASAQAIWPESRFERSVKMRR